MGKTFLRALLLSSGFRGSGVASCSPRVPCPGVLFDVALNLHARAPLV